MNPYDAEFLGSQLLQKYNLLTKGWHIRLTSSKRKFGSCHYWIRQIRLSRYLIQVNHYDEVRDTILHEIAHALAGEEHGHDSHWKQICIQIGARPERCYGKETVRVYRLIGSCPSCSKKFYRNRQPKDRIRYCRACGVERGKFVYEANPEFEKIFNLSKKPIDRLPKIVIESFQDRKKREEVEPILENETETEVQETEVQKAVKISEQEKEWLEKMSLLLIKKSTLPVTQRGKVGTLAVRVADNGQLGFSTSAGDIFKGFTNVVIGWDKDSRTMSITGVDLKKLPKGVSETDTFLMGQSKDSGARYMSAAGLFKYDSIGYDYKASGSHSFEATANEEKHSVTFVLPEKMEPKAKVPRKKREPKANAAGAGAAASAPPASTISDDELVLNEA